MEQEIKIKVKIKVSDLYHFLLQYNYKKISGIVGLVISFGAAIYLGCTFRQNQTNVNVVLSFIALLWTVIQPILLFQRAAQQVTKNPAFQEEIEYIFDDKKMTIRQRSEKAEVPWEGIVKIKEDRKQILLFTSQVHACILPKEQFRNEYNQLKELLEKKKK